MYDDKHIKDVAHDMLNKVRIAHALRQVDANVGVAMACYFLERAFSDRDPKELAKIVSDVMTEQSTPESKRAATDEANRILRESVQVAAMQEAHGKPN